MANIPYGYTGTSAAPGYMFDLNNVLTANDFGIGNNYAIPNYGSLTPDPVGNISPVMAPSQSNGGGIKATLPMPDFLTSQIGGGGSMPAGITTDVTGAAQNFFDPDSFMGELAGFFGSEDVGNLGQGIMSGIGAITNIANAWNAFKQLGLAEEMFDFQKKAFNTQLGDTRKNYENRIRQLAEYRAATQGHDQDYIDDFVKERSLG